MFFCFLQMRKCDHNIWLRLNRIFVWNEWKKKFPKLKIGNNVTLSDIVRLRNSEVVPGALNKWKKNELLCRLFTHIELLAVFGDSISFCFSTSFQYLKSLWTYHKEIWKGNFTLIIYLKMSSEGWRSTGKNW